MSKTEQTSKLPDCAGKISQRADRTKYAGYQTDKSPVSLPIATLSSVRLERITPSVFTLPLSVLLLATGKPDPSSVETSCPSEQVMEQLNAPPHASPHPHRRPCERWTVAGSEHGE